MNACARDGAEAGQLERQLVIAGREARQTKESVLIGHRRRRSHDRRARQRDGDAGKDGVRRIGNRAVDRAGRRADRLRTRDGRRDDEEKKAEERRQAPDEGHDCNLQMCVASTLNMYGCQTRET